ncbi:hypothetical protein J6590_009665 [Homalodisca vitripennis]|nr:hypothetical protein J6590_009665 [Homalodisca vitripennis]
MFKLSPCTSKVYSPTRGSSLLERIVRGTRCTVLIECALVRTGYYAVQIQNLMPHHREHNHVLSYQWFDCWCL